MTRVLIVEDSRIAAKSLEENLRASGEFEPAASIENAANAIIACMRGGIDLVLMDVCTADDESGISAAEEIKRCYPGIRVIMMTSMPEHSFLQKARQAGCDSFWYKEFGSTELLEVCRRTMAGERIWPEGPPTIRIGCTDSTALTERELDILRDLALGMKYEESARHLNISTNTVKYHVKNLLQKTGYSSTMRLIADVVEKRLILPGY